MAKIEYVSTFRAPTEYEAAAARARRQRALAEALAQQQYQAQDITAPIPSAAPIVQGLQAYLMARQLKKAEEAEEKAQKADIEGVAELQRGLGPQERVAEADMFASPDEMASKYTAPRMETYTPSAEERQAILDRAFVSGSPRTQRLAELMMTRDQQKPDSKVMEFGGQLLSIAGDRATPVTMGGRAVTAPTAAEAPKVHGNLQWNATSQKWEPIPGYTPGGGTNVTVKLPGDKTRDVYSEKLSEGLAGQDLAVIEAGNQAIPRIEMSYNVRDLLAQNPITGFAAEQRLGFEKALAAAGFVKGDRASITENLASTLAKTTLGVVRTSGLGSGQGFTDKDREFLEKAAAGKIDLSNANLNYLAELNEKAARYDIERSNKVRSRLRQMPNFQQMPGALPDITPPPSYSTRKFKVIRPGQ